MKSLYELFPKFLEVAKSSKENLLKLKEVAVQFRDLEFASSIREIERELYPESPETEAAKQLANKLSTLYAMVEIKCDDATSWLIHETTKQFIELGEQFSIREASKLMVKHREIFNLKTR